MRPCRDRYQRGWRRRRARVGAGDSQRARYARAVLVHELRLKYERSVQRTIERAPPESQIYPAYRAPDRNRVDSIDGLFGKSLLTITSDGKAGELEVRALAQVPVIAKSRRERQAAKTLVDWLVGLEIFGALAEPVNRGHLQLLIKAERREDLAQRESGPLETLFAQKALDDVRVFHGMQIVAMSHVLLAHRHQEPAHLHLEPERQR